MSIATRIPALLLCALMLGLYGTAYAVTTEKDVPRLVDELVQGGDASETAAQELLKFPAKTVPALLEAIKHGHDNPRVRTVLYKAMDVTAVKPAAGYINDESDVVRTIARDLLRGMGDEAVPVLLDMMGRPESHDAAVDVLKITAGSDKFMSQLEAQTKSGNPLLRAGAAFILGWHKDQKAEPEILRLMDDDDPDVRAAAIKGYMYLHADSPEAFNKDIVLAKLSDSEPEVRSTAVDIASSIYDDDLRDKLLGMLESEKDRGVLTKVVVLLANEGEAAAIFPIIKLLDSKDTDYDFQANNIWALGELKAKEAVPYLVAPFKSGEPVNLVVRKDTFTALANIGEPVELGPFLKYLEPGDPHDNSTNDVLEMIESLARKDDEKVINALVGYYDKATVSQKAVIDRTLKRIRK